MIVWKDLSTGIVTNDKAVDRRRPVRRALAPLANHGSIWTRPLARAAATNQTVPNRMALAIALANGAGIDASEGTESIAFTTPQPTWIEHGTFGVGSAGLGTALATATFVTGETIGHGLDADPVAAGVQDTGVVFFASAVTIVDARRYANPMLAELTFVTCAPTVVLSASRPRSKKDRQRCNERGSQQTTPVYQGSQGASKIIDPLVDHFFPLLRGRSSHARVGHL